MAVIVSVNGTPRDVDGEVISIVEAQDERTTLKLRFADGFIPSQRDEITVVDGATTVFGGLVDSIDGADDGGEGPFRITVNCVSWWVYLDYRLITGGYTGPIIEIDHSTAANPGQITTKVPHGLVNGDTVTIIGHPGTPLLNYSLYAVTVIDTDEFSIPVEITSGAGAAGTVQRTAIVSLKRVLEDLVNFYLTDYGITLDPTQAIGPTGATAGLNWIDKKASDILRDLSVLSGGWKATLSTTKVLKMVPPEVGLPSAPFAMTDGDEHHLSLSFSESGEEYATRIVLKGGGSKTQIITKSWTVDAAIISAGYVDTDIPSTPLDAPTATLDTGGGPVAKTIGNSGNEFIWSWNGGANGTARVTPGTVSPPVALGDVFAVTYTAQYPFTLVSDSADTPQVDMKVEYDDVTDVPAAQLILDGLIAKHHRDVRTYKIITMDSGFEVGQLLTLSLTSYGGISLVAPIVGMTRDLQEEIWIYTLMVQSGAIKSGPLDYFRGLGSGRSGGSAYTGGINPVAIHTEVGGNFNLGGDTDRTRTPASGVYTKVVNAALYIAPSNFVADVNIELWARNTAVQVTARLQDLTASTTAGTSSGVTSQTPVFTTFSATLIAGHRYELQITSNVSGEGIYAMGSLQSA